MQLPLAIAPDLARLVATAYHEAGHAIVARRLGYRVTRIVLEPDGSGSCAASNPVPYLRTPADWLDVLVAGVAAQARYIGRWDWAGAEHDLANALGLAAEVRGWSSRTRSPRGRVGEAAQWIHRLFETDADLWRQVVVLASDLVQRHAGLLVLSGASAERLRQGHQLRDGNAKGIREPKGIHESKVSLAALDPAHVCPVELAPLGQLLLGDSQPPSVFPNGSTEGGQLLSPHRHAIERAG